MNPTISHFPVKKTRIGFHYYPDTLHYRETDLETWLPELKSLGASWLVLQSSSKRAIPESFLNGLTSAGIEPLVQFSLSLDNPPTVEEMQTLLETYARYGVNGIIFFDRPNDRLAWQSSDWVQQDLVERFLDRYIPLANLALQTGMNPVFPPLEPGGSYWDTAFLRSAIESLIKRKQNALLYKLVLSSYTWTGNHPLNWGNGGPQRWSESKPYYTPPNQEDQRGFRNYEWYNAITQALLHDVVPVILLGAGATFDPIKTPTEQMAIDTTGETNLNIARLLAFEDDVLSSDNQTILQPIPENILSGNFWLLAAEANSPYTRQAWYQNNGTNQSLVQMMKDWMNNQHQPDEKYIRTKIQDEPYDPPKRASKEVVKPRVDQPATSGQPIHHYLLIPTYEWGIADWHLNVINPFVKRHMPTIGFSLEEASLAERVTVIGNQQTFSEEQLDELRRNGCQVERISGDGTSIASQLAER